MQSHPDPPFTFELLAVVDVKNDGVSQDASPDLAPMLAAEIIKALTALPWVIDAEVRLAS